MLVSGVKEIWKLAPLAPVEYTSSRFRSEPAPLLEEERHVGFLALVADVAYPFDVHGPRAWAAFAANDHPVDAVEVEFSDRADERFDGEKPHGRGHILNVPDARFLGSILDRRAQPDVARCSVIAISRVDIVAHARAALRQNLERVMVGLFHRIENLIDEIRRYAFVEQVAHRIDENHPMLFPVQRLLQPFRAQRKIETGFERMPRHATKPLCEALGVAIIAARADFRAARDRVPRRVRPLYL